MLVKDQKWGKSSRRSMKILTIIVTYNGMRWAQRCLQSLRDSEVHTDIYVIDNGSTDGTQAFIREHFPEAVMVQNARNEGFGRANNRGLRYALEHGYDYVYLLNEDAWIMPSTLGELITCHRNHPEFGLLSPAQWQADGKALDRNFLKGPCNQNHRLQSDLQSGSFREEVYEVETVMAAHWLLPASTIRKIGFFSPTYPHYGEDDDYTARLRFHGLQAGVVMTARAVHDRQHRQESREQLFYMHYICILKLFSNPSLSMGRAWYCCIGYTLKAIRRHRSLRPVGNVVKVLKRWRTIRRNRLISIHQKGNFPSA